MCIYAQQTHKLLVALTFQGRRFNVQTTSRHRFDAFLWVHAPVPYNTALRWRLKHSTLIGMSNFQLNKSSYHLRLPLHVHVAQINEAAVRVIQYYKADNPE